MRGVTATFHVFEEFIQLIPMKDTVTGADIFEALIKFLFEMKFDISKLNHLGIIRRLYVPNL